MFKQNKYYTWYYTLIRHAQSRQLTGYAEKHHIIPKSLGGSNDESNIVALTAREHYICHLLLTKFTIGAANQKMWYAIHRMTNKGATEIKSSRIYDYIRREHAAIVSAALLGKSYMETRGKSHAHPISDYQRSRIKESNSARVWTDESKNKLSASQKKRKEERPESFVQHTWTDESRKKLSAARTRNAIKYTFTHPVHGKFTGSTGDLGRAYGIRTSEVYKLAKGGYQSYKGWMLVSQDCFHIF